MRGTHICSAFIGVKSGIIPAYAGNTWCGRSFSPSKRDHPRVCGEHWGIALTVAGVAGSSPRMRGTPEACVGVHVAWGIIPAYAGNTTTPLSSHVFDRDHPRVCGEHILDDSSAYILMGSSPRMRGTRRLPAVRRRRHGIIPAYAGNTSPLTKRTVRARDHPRVCGEHLVRTVIFAVKAGSSPRMRGTLHDWPIHVVVEGIIPAYAGNTPRPRSKSPLPRDHPRVCGEHSMYPSILRDEWGSSPRMRGTLFVNFFYFRRVGIIPAYAGNTSIGIAVPAELRDHPRVCGEHWSLGNESEELEGSSPRMRGTPAIFVPRTLLIGIIPAYAGNTRYPCSPYPTARDHPRVCGEHYHERGVSKS